MLGFLAARAVDGIERVEGGSYTRTMPAAHGHAVVEFDLVPARTHIDARIHCDDPQDLEEVVARCRHLLDLDADGRAIARHFACDPVLGKLATAHPGQRVAGTVDPHELAIRAVVGQQVSVAAARTVLGRLVRAHGTAIAPAVNGRGAVTHVFPDAPTIASIDPETLPMPRARARAVLAVARALADGTVDLGPGADAERASVALLALPGIGPWTASYIRIRALGDPDVMLVDDLGVRRTLAHQRGETALPNGAEVAAASEGWRPWRSYAVAYLWSAEPPPGRSTVVR